MRNWLMFSGPISAALLIASQLGVSAQPAGSGSPAFVGAVGFGAGANGWRGGEIYTITSSGDRGRGTLRNCAATNGQPRVCVFNFSGTIRIKKPIIVGSNLYIAGQTAPGKGVQVRLSQGSVGTPLIIKNAHDVLIRFLKLRPGTGNKVTPSIDAITVEGSRNIYLDRLSLQYASDETVNVHVNDQPTHNITLARSIVAYSLDKSVHPKGRHSKGALICSNEGTPNAGVPCGRVTLYANLFAHNRDRNPDLKGTAGYPIEVINNIFYNASTQNGEFYDLLGDLDVHYIGNTIIAGPATSRTLRPPGVEGFATNVNNALRIYASDNDHYGCGKRKRRPVIAANSEQFLVNNAIGGSGLTARPQGEVYVLVRNAVGATAPAWGKPDTLDRRVMRDHKNCAGKLINKPEQAGGWPDLPSLAGPVDTDRDGMPDSWENANGLNAQNPGDAWGDADANSRSNVEDYLASRAGDPAPATN